MAAVLSGVGSHDLSLGGLFCEEGPIMPRTAALLFFHGAKRWPGGRSAGRRLPSGQWERRNPAA